MATDNQLRDLRAFLVNAEPTERIHLLIDVVDELQRHRRFANAVVYARDEWVEDFEDDAATRGTRLAANVALAIEQLETRALDERTATREQQKRERRGKGRG